MAYSESPYRVVYQTDTYEIRYYEERLIVETQYSNQNNGFQKSTINIKIEDRRSS